MLPKFRHMSIVIGFFKVVLPKFRHMGIMIGN